MEVEVLGSADDVARRAAQIIAARARSAVEARGTFLIATSGGSTPRATFEYLARAEVPWDRVHWFQVDERAVPSESAERNLRMLRETLLDRVPARVHSMPVEDEDLLGAAERYAVVLRRYAGAPVVLDLVHLGIGIDGHTASLVPGDPVLEVLDRDVAITGPYQGHRRMTLTFPILRRAREVLWLATGAAKREVLRQLVHSDARVPAGRVDAAVTRLITDAEAWG